MREIKFRAWDKFFKKMYLPDDFMEGEYWKISPHFLISPNGNKLWSNIQDSRTRDRMEEDIVIMQYTGLKDKNGQEIYEGDVLKCGDHIAPVQFGHYDSYCGMGLYVMGYGFHVSKNERTPFMIGENCEIIGNIYENPELIPK